MGRAWSLAAALLAALVGAPVGAADAPYPSRPVRVIVAYPPGGSTDVLARILAPRLTELLGQTIVIENKPGAAGVIGYDAAAKAPKDGYTLGMIISSYVIAPLLPGTSVPFDPAKDLAPVILLGWSPNVLSVPASHPARDVGALVAMAKARPGTLTIGHAGNGTVVHLTAELFKRRAGIDLVVVPYKGGGPVVTDLIGGHLDMGFNQLTTVLAHIQGGQIRPLALAAPTRARVLPELPTLDEAGFSGIHTSEWYGIAVPTGTPAAVIARLNAAFGSALADPTVAARCAELALELEPPGGPDRLQALLTSETAKWSAIIRETGVSNE